MFIQSQGFLTFDKGPHICGLCAMSGPRGEMAKGQSFLESVSWPNESLVAKHFRLERKHRITTITHGLANRCLTIRLSAPDVSLSFQSASHSFSTYAPRDGVMT